MRRSRKALLAILVLMGLFLLAYLLMPWLDGTRGMQVVEIADAGRRSTFLLRAPADQENIVSLSLKIGGELKAGGVVRLAAPGQEVLVRKVLMEGKVDTDYRGDWYARECELTYEPREGASGRLEISYSFNSARSIGDQRQ